MFEARTWSDLMHGAVFCSFKQSTPSSASIIDWHEVSSERMARSRSHHKPCLLLVTPLVRCEGTLKNQRNKTKEGSSTRIPRDLNYASNATRKKTRKRLCPSEGLLKKKAWDDCPPLHNQCKGKRVLEDYKSHHNESDTIIVVAGRDEASKTAYRSFEELLVIAKSSR